MLADPCFSFKSCRSNPTGPHRRAGGSYERGAVLCIAGVQFYYWPNAICRWWTYRNTIGTNALYYRGIGFMAQKLIDLSMPVHNEMIAFPRVVRPALVMYETWQGFAERIGAAKYGVDSLTAHYMVVIGDQSAHIWISASSAGSRARTRRDSTRILLRRWRLPGLPSLA